MAGSATNWLALGAVALLLWVARGVLPPFVVGGVVHCFARAGFSSRPYRRTRLRTRP